MKQITWRERLRYWFDNVMARGTIALLLWLGLLSLALIVGVAILTWLLNFDVREDGARIPLQALIWMNLMRTLDAGTMGGDTGNEGFLGSMLFVTLGGIFIVSTLIGIISNGISSKLEDLKKGRSFVVEQNHTLILGWTPQVFTIISELVEANANQKKPCIVILADQDAMHMKDELSARVADTKKTRVVFRSGNPLDPADLEIVNPDAARSIIVLAPQVEDPDTDVIKTILAITNNPKRKEGKYHIVAEIREPKNVEVAKMVGRDEAQIVLVGDLVSRITVQTCRQSGLSVIYTDLLNFGGDEIYFKAEPALAGKTFGEALSAYEDSTVIGIHSANNTTQLNPPMDAPLRADDQIIAISADDDTIKLNGHAQIGIDENAIQPKQSAAPAPERTLILGWNHRGPAILRELDDYVAPGSQTMIVANVPDLATELDALKNQTITFQQKETTSRPVLDALKVESFDHIIVLSYADTLDQQRADAQTLITLLHLRDLSEHRSKQLSIVSEMLDVRNRELAEVTRADDFIVSDQLISLMLSQVSENKHLNAVFADLFDPEGSEIYLKPAPDYVKPDMPVSYYTLVEAARRRGQVALGYRLKRDARDAAKNYGVVMNPKKSDKVQFTAGDKVIVLAES